jgi:putative serine protease PepD
MSLRATVLAAVLIGLATPTAIIAGCDGDDPAASAHRATGPATTSVLAGLQQQFVKVVKTVSPQVVEIQSPIGLGSGVIFDDQGNVVTNAHVVQGSRRFAVRMAGGERHTATLVGSDPSHDIAVVHLTGLTPPRATFANSPSPVGSLVMAIGNPLGLRSSVTEGIVSSLERTVSEGGGVTLKPVIQTSAAINPGNSGGALVDMSGRVIGIPTLAALDPEMGGAEAQGIGFAIPSSVVVEIADRLIGGT